MTDRDDEIARVLAGRRVPPHRAGFWDDVSAAAAADGDAAGRRWAPGRSGLAAAAAVVVAALGLATFLAMRDGGDTEVAAVPPQPEATAPEPSAAAVDTTLVATTVEASRASARFVGGTVLGEGRLAGVSADATVAWLTDPDPSSDRVGCEGAPAPVLWAVDADGERVRATADPEVTGDVLTGPDDRVAVVHFCEDMFSGLWVGTSDAAGRLEVSQVDLGVQTNLTWGTVRYAPDGRLTAVDRGVDFDPASSALVAIDPDAAATEVLAEGVTDGAVLDGGALMTVTAAHEVRIGDVVVAELAPAYVGPYVVATNGTDRVVVNTDTVEVFDAAGDPVGSAEPGLPAEVVAVSPDGRWQAASTVNADPPALRLLHDGEPWATRSGVGLGWVIAVTDDGVVIGEDPTIGGVRTVALAEDEGAAPPPAPVQAPSTTSPETTAPPATAAPEPFLGPRPDAGDVVGVVGVADDDTLNVRSAPGTGNAITAELAPLASAVSTGQAVLTDDQGLWFELELDGGTTGWANAAFLSELGRVDDVTAEVVAASGGAPPAAETMRDLGLAVAATRTSDQPPSEVTFVDGPVGVDLNEVVVDVIGLGDDALEGERLHIFGAPAASGEGFTLGAVERTLLCGRGVADGGACT